MTFFFRLSCFVFALMLGFSPALAQVTLKSNVVVDSDIVTLGDLMSGAGRLSRQPVFRAPAPGQSGVVSASDIAIHAYRHGLDIGEVGSVEAVSIRRINNAIGQAAIADMLSYAVAQQTGEALSNIRLMSADLPGSVRHDENKQTPQIIDLRLDEARGRVSGLLITHTNTGLQRTTLNAGVEVDAETFVLSQDIARGDIVKARNVQSVMRARRTLTGTITHKDQIVGMEAVRNLSAGATLRSRDLKAPVVVGRNREVLLMIKRGGLSLTARAKAMQNGAKGDVIDVLNLRSKKVVQGTVQADGTVLVGGVLRGYAQPVSVRKALARRDAPRATRQIGLPNIRSSLRGAIDGTQTSEARLYDSDTDQLILNTFRAEGAS